MVKSVWSICARVRTTGELLLLTMVLVRTTVLPTGTVPKSRVAAVATSPVACCAAGWLALRAEQPSMVVRVRRTITRLVRVPRFTGASTNAVRPYGRGFTSSLRHSECQSPKRLKRGIVQPNAVCSEGCAGVDIGSEPRSRPYGHYRSGTVVTWVTREMPNAAERPKWKSARRKLLPWATEVLRHNFSWG